MFGSEGIPTPGPLVMVFATQKIPEGMLVKGLLEAEGITVFVKGESEGPYRIGPVYLWVPEEFEVQARLVLADAAAGSQPE
jgi:Putative prokaryotic signal transducing protein